MIGNTAGKRKKMAAALAAVSLYLEQEEAAMDEQKESLTQSGSTGLNHWGHSGRQEMMDMRRLVQLRAIRY